MRRPDRCRACGEVLIGYGFFAGCDGHGRGMDPRDCTPDVDCSTLEELARWEEACRRAAEGRLDGYRWGGIGAYRLVDHDRWCRGAHARLVERVRHTQQAQARHHVRWAVTR